MKTVYIAGIENEDAIQTAAWFEGNGWQVASCRLDGEAEETRKIAEQAAAEMAELDMLVICVGTLCPQDGAVGTGHDYEALLDTFDRNVNGARYCIEAFLPSLRKGEGKRICFLTKMESSVSMSGEKDNFAQHISDAAVHMMGRIYFNALRKEGFTMRVFCADGEPGGMYAGEYMTSAMCYDANEPYVHSDENRYVMRDSHLREITW